MNDGVSAIVERALHELLLILGVFFTIIILAVRVGLGLATLRGSKEKIILALFLYLLLFLIASLLSREIAPFARTLLEKGPLVHMVLSLALILWGIFLLFSQDTSKNLYQGLLIVPCPACLSAIILSITIYSEYFRISPLFFGILQSLIFSLIAGMSCFFLKNFQKTIGFRKETTISLFMIYTGLYIIGSLIIPSKIETAKEFYKNLSYHSTEIPSKFLLPVVTIFLLTFILGFLKRRS